MKKCEQLVELILRNILVSHSVWALNAHSWLSMGLLICTTLLKAISDLPKVLELEENENSFKLVIGVCISAGKDYF